MGKIRILIADDHPVVRKGLEAALENEVDIEVVGQASDGKDAIEFARKLQPDVILMDLRMPVVDGVEAIRQIKSENPNTKFVILTIYDDEYILEGIKAGAQAYLLKDCPIEDMHRAIRAVCEGRFLFESNVGGQVLAHMVQLNGKVKHKDVLSKRETEVLKLVAKGAANKEVADSLCVCESTIKTQIQRIFQKLGANDRTQAVTKAIKKGIISP